MSENFEFDALHHGKNPSDPVYGETKIEVPEGMLEAAKMAVQDYNHFNPNDVLPCLEAALRWQRDRELTPEQKAEGVRRLRNLRSSPYTENDEQLECWLEQFVMWIYRLYDAPEPEVPEEIKGLMRIHLASVRNQEDLDRLVKKLNIEAFRRGQRAKV